jgi:hypothetical protein
MEIVKQNLRNRMFGWKILPGVRGVGGGSVAQVHGAPCRSHLTVVTPENLKLAMESSVESEMKTCYNVWPGTGGWIWGSGWWDERG